MAEAASECMARAGDGFRDAAQEERRAHGVVREAQRSRRELPQGQPPARHPWAEIPLPVGYAGRVIRCGC